MANLDEYIFGYHKGKVDASDNCKLINSLLKLGICSEITSDGEFSLHRRDKERFTSYAKNKIRYKLSFPLGLYGLVYRGRYRYGVFLALILSVIVYVYSSGVVWDIRISGNDRLSDYNIEELLTEHGLSVGTRWRKIDKNKIENEFLRATPDIAWLSVNRRGTVAYVQVIESENIGVKEEVGYPFSNIVADRDGVIEEITVERGSATVKVGDVVKRGDILISGVVENEKGVTFCRAQGSIRATNVATLTAVAKSEVVRKTPKAQRLTELRVILFKFSINIFKNYRNCENSCDIIRENRKIALFGKYRLPIYIEKAYAITYDEAKYLRSEDEMVAAAKRELDGKIYSMFKDADVVKLRTQGEFKDGMYFINSRVFYSTDIGEERAIEIN